MTWVAVGVGAVGTIAGGMMAADAAGDAADAQLQSTREANATQLEMFRQARADQEPWRQRGNQAGNMLQYYLGLDPNGAGGAAAANNYGLGAAPTIEQFTTQTPNARPGPRLNFLGNDYSGPAWEGVPRGMNPALLNFGGGMNATVDRAGYDAALKSYNERLQAAQAASTAAASGDPRFGSLLKQFTGESVATDPGYQFGLHQGEQTITNNRASLGSLLSGATLKDLTKFGNDYGGTKFNEAWSRDQGNKSMINNLLAGVSGTGQTAATNIGSQGIATGNALAGNIIGGGNARASGYVGGANAINGAIGGAANQFTSASLLRDVMGGGIYGYGGGVGNSPGAAYYRDDPGYGGNPVA